MDHGQRINRGFVRRDVAVLNGFVSQKVSSTDPVFHRRLATDDLSDLKLYFLASRPAIDGVRVWVRSSRFPESKWVRSAHFRVRRPHAFRSGFARHVFPRSHGTANHGQLTTDD
jgi:hypothetical protein